jgi:hypothetical protein
MPSVRSVFLSFWFDAIGLLIEHPRDPKQGLFSKRHTHHTLKHLVNRAFGNTKKAGHHFCTG